MRDLFPRAFILGNGYHRVQVDEFFARARTAYERPQLDASTLSALDIRQAAFDLVKGGYKVGPVDIALDRLEAAFATRAKDQFVSAYGQQAWMQDLAQRAQGLYPRLRRPVGKRFTAPVKSGKGYSRKEVDLFLGRITDFFDKGKPLTADDVRTVTFKRVGKRGAYDERVVDAYLARTIEILVGVQ